MNVSLHLRFIVGVMATAVSVPATASFAQTNVFPSAGNAGIGTTNPQYTLSLGGAGYRVGFYSDATHYNNIEFYNTSTGGMIFDHQTAAGGGYSWRYAGSPLVTFQAGGNVGIGTSSPTDKLSVIGDIRLGDASDARGLNIAENYMSLGETENAATTILGNNIKVTNGTSNTLQVSTSSADGSNWIGISYLNGFTLNHLGPLAVGTLCNENGGELMRVAINGNVGIGTTNPTQKLSVNGTIRAKEVIVEASPWPDDVFDDSYKLKALSEVEASIKAEGHLPGVPSAGTVGEHGVAVGEMQKTLLRKIEELTLYVIRQNQRIEALQAQLNALKDK